MWQAANEIERLRAANVVEIDDLRSRNAQLREREEMLRAQLAKAEAVAQAADTVCARLGSIGSIYSDHCTVEDLMNALHEWKPL